MQNCAVVIPTFNGGMNFRLLMTSLYNQDYVPHRVVVIDSESQDDTVETAQKFGCEVIVINQKDFNHGATRQMGAEKVRNAEIVVFLTQDSVLADSTALGNLVSVFNEDESIGAAYGRQLPHVDSGPIGAHARLFNYPMGSKIKSMEDASKAGIKTAFMSNSFAAYRWSALQLVGGFPANTILGEDTYVAAKMLLNGWKIAYCANAQVYHSHDYGYKEEFKRYFDIGVFHAREAWIRKCFGQAEGEGARYVKSELEYLWKNGYALLIPSALLRTAIKLLGYRLGMLEEKIPALMKVNLSMHKRYWV